MADYRPVVITASGTSIARALRSGEIGSGQIGGVIIASGGVEAGALGSGAVVSGNIASGQIGTDHIADGAIVSGLIASGQIGTDHIADGAVLSGNIASGQIGSDHLAAGAVVSGNIASGQVGYAHLASGAVGSGTIASGVVFGVNIASGTITGEKLDPSITISRARLVLDDVNFVAGEDMAQGVAATPGISGNLVTANAFVLTRMPAVGLVASGVVSGAVVRLAMDGVVPGISGLTGANGGKPVWVQLSGFLGTTAPSASGYTQQVVGSVAASGSTILRWSVESVFLAE